MDNPAVKLAVGIDVAGPGEDETVVMVRCGRSLIAQQAWPEQDPRGAVAAFLAPYKPRIEELNIDSAGIGHYFAQHFDDLGYEVNFVNVGEVVAANVDTEHFVNLKAQLYLGVAAALRGRGYRRCARRHDDLATGVDSLQA